MYRLEHGSEDTERMKKEAPGIAQIQQYQARTRDDYELNKLARKHFRVRNLIMLCTIRAGIRAKSWNI